MTPEQFVYWLQGFFEVSQNKELTPEQVIIVKDHLAQVFTKVTPDREISDEEEASVHDPLKGLSKEEIQKAIIDSFDKTQKKSNKDFWKRIIRHRKRRNPYWLETVDPCNIRFC